jgi:hypothetical protein
MLDPNNDSEDEMINVSGMKKALPSVDWRDGILALSDARECGQRDR